MNDWYVHHPVPKMTQVEVRDGRRQQYLTVCFFVVIMADLAIRIAIDTHLLSIPPAFCLIGDVTFALALLLLGAYARRLAKRWTAHKMIFAYRDAAVIMLRDIELQE